MNPTIESNVKTTVLEYCKYNSYSSFEYARGEGVLASECVITSRQMPWNSGDGIEYCIWMDGELVYTISEGQSEAFFIAAGRILTIR